MRNEPSNEEEGALALQQMFSRDPIPAGVTDFHVIDRYEVTCSKGS